jgi:hypothetical protein
VNGDRRHGIGPALIAGLALLVIAGFAAVLLIGGLVLLRWIGAS